MSERRQAKPDPIAAWRDPPDWLIALLLALALVHIGLEFAPAAAKRAVWRAAELSPQRLWADIEHGRYVAGAAARLFGYMLFHINTAHLLVNLTGIYVAGAYVARVFEARLSPRASDARVAFFTLLILSGIAAGLVYVAANPNSWSGMMGASGAAAGLFGAAAFAFLADGEPRRLVAFAKIAGVSAVLLGSGVALDLSAVSKWLFGSVSAWQAHVGGYLFGLLTFPLFARLAGAKNPAA